MKPKYHYVNISFEGGSHVSSTHNTKALALKAAERYKVWAADNAKLLGYKAPSYTSIDVYPSNEHMGPF